MSPGTDVLPLDDASSVWRQLSDRIERFVAAWESENADPPTVAQFLDGTAPASRRLTAVELIKVDLEYRWLRRKQPRPLEAYLAEFPFLADDTPVDLIYEECHVRRKAGETFDPDEPYRRFPAQADALRRLLGAGPALQTTMLKKPEPNKTSKLQPGERIDDFELLTRLGEGAFGAVFLARQVSMQRIVALKATADRGSEPQTLAQLDHEHIVRVYDQRLVADRGLRLMYMQYAAGGTLEDAMRRMKSIPIDERTGRDFLAAVDAMLADRGESPPSESLVRSRLAGMQWPEVVCWLGSRLARALDYAHRAGVLHRDLKPANILLTSEGSPKLADFNISYSNKVEGATPAAYFGGSLAYMSPEQLEACSPAHDRTPSDLDARSDLYSLGVVLWELLTGLRPFEDESMQRSWGQTLELMVNRRRAGPPQGSIAMLVRNAATGLDEVLTTCLSSDVDDRYGSGEGLARQLDFCLMPETRRLLSPRTGRWSFALSHPVWSVVGLTILPNALAGAFNYQYNHEEIIKHLPDAEGVFHRTQLAINLILFPLGGIYGVVRARTIGQYIVDPPLRATLDEAGYAEMRKRCLETGREAATISISLWALAGAVYPTSMHWGLGAAVMSTYLHFFTSLVLCGLAAAAYPFFLVTLLGVRRYYPLFVRFDAMTADDRTELEKLRRWAWFYLGLAALVPMSAVAILALTGSTARYALATSAVVGIVGFAASLTALRMLLTDIEALLPLMRNARQRPSQSFG